MVSMGNVKRKSKTLEKGKKKVEEGELLPSWGTKKI